MFAPAISGAKPARGTWARSSLPKFPAWQHFAESFSLLRMLLDASQLFATVVPRTPVIPPFFSRDAERPGNSGSIRGPRHPSLPETTLERVRCGRIDPHLLDGT